MSTRTDCHPARRRGRTVATALSALTVGVTVAGAAAGVAAATPAPGHHTPSSQSNRILSVVETGNDPGASRTTQRQYISPSSGDRYFLMDQYAGAKLNYVDWEKDTPAGAGHRSVDQIDVDPGQQSWSEQTATIPTLPAPSLGIQSSGQAVKQAVKDGRATVKGKTKIDRQTVLLLSVKPTAANEQSVALYVDPSTAAPVSETDVITSKQYTFTVRSNWEPATSSALSQLESKPTIPAGYTKSPPTS